MMARAINHRRRVGHLRQQLWRDKGADFDLSDTRAILCFDPCELSLRREDCLNALQAIAGSDLANRNLCHHASLIDGCRVLTGVEVAHSPTRTTTLP